MTLSETDISDEMLTAYLDGELSQHESDLIAQALIDSPALAGRLAALDIPMSELRPAFDQMLDDMPSGILPPPQTAPARFGWADMAAAAGFALVMGLGIGALTLKPNADPAGWHDYVAAYQALYVKDTLSVVEQSSEATAAQLALVSTTLGRPLGAATEVPGFKYKRAQILGYRGKPLVQMAYLTEDGSPMALCILAAKDADELETMRLEGLAAASWSDGEFAYLLIGGQDAARIADAARHLQSAL